MASNDPIDPRIRLAIARWPEGAHRGAVSAFCREHNISRKTFYAIRSRARDEGQAAVLQPRSRRPKSSPTKITDEIADQAVAVRAALEDSGLDCGPISVFEKMKSMGLTPPSEASLSRIFRARNVARCQPNKKPRSAYHRFVYPAPNACWQLDGTEYTLITGQECVIFQVEDDHSRTAVGSHVAPDETGQAAIDAFTKATTIYGVPQRLLTDNARAFNQDRQGRPAPLSTFVRSLGVEPITGKPYKPTTQGKNERFHQTLFRWLKKQPPARTLHELQALVDEFDRIYNTERPHQGLPGRMTPAQAWAATPVADPPAKPAPAQESELLPTAYPDRSGRKRTKIESNGVVRVCGIKFNITRRRAGEAIDVVWNATEVVVANLDGEAIASWNWPPAGVTYVGNGIRPGRSRRS